MNLTDPERINALNQLERAGITSSDAATALRGVCELAGDIGYTEWLARVAQQSFGELLAEYGHDAARAVAAIRPKLELPTDDPFLTLRGAAATVANATLWTPAEALAVISLANIGVRAEEIIAPWKDQI